MKPNYFIYPFTAIVGQEQMKQSLILNAINHRLSGVLIRGEKGTAKSTAVRALAAVLPEIEVVEDCPFNCDPKDLNKLCPNCKARKERNEPLPVARRKIKVVNLPVSATEDRVVGTLDIEQAIKTGEKRFEPGILAEANRGILYVDEVNLLDDHLVDVLLDSAAMGINSIEREGISFSHPADFILVGTMNPEEGELRPQLLDRFGLCVSIEGIKDIEQRVEVVRRRTEFEQDPEAFLEKWKPEEERLRQRIVEAQRLLPQVKISEEMLLKIANLAIEIGVDGHRADIVMMKSAMTLAAFNQRTEITLRDIEETAELALLHRVRRRPFEEVKLDRERIRELLYNNQPVKKRE